MLLILLTGFLFEKKVEMKARGKLFSFLRDYHKVVGVFEGF